MGFSFCTRQRKQCHCLHTVTFSLSTICTMFYTAQYYINVTQFMSLKTIYIKKNQQDTNANVGGLGCFFFLQYMEKTLRL